MSDEREVLTDNTPPGITDELAEALIERGLVRVADRRHVVDLLEAALAGRTVIDQPEPNAWRNRLDGHMDIWTIGGWSVSSCPAGVSISTSTDGLGGGLMFDTPAKARTFGIALIAAADRLAAESSKGGDPSRG